MKVTYFMQKLCFFLFLLMSLSIYQANFIVQAYEQKDDSGGYDSQSKNPLHNHDTPRELIVRLSPNFSVDQLREFSRPFGAESVSSVFSLTTRGGKHPVLRRIYRLQFPLGSSLEQLHEIYTKNKLIENVEMNRLNRFCAEITPSDPRYSEQWNLPAMNLPKAWGIEQGKPSVTIAVVDSGIMRNHPDLQNQLWRNLSEIANNGVDDDENGYVDDIIGWDFSDAPTLQGLGDWKTRDNSPDDESGHGTQVSGIIAAEANNNLGIAGVAWGCRLMPLRAGFRLAGGGSFLQNDDIAAAIVYAADNGADIINLSLGDTVNAFVIQHAVEYAYSRGCVLVAAAGNSSEPGSYYPAALENVLSVASIDTEGQLSGSNFGASIAIAAPGEDILTTELFPDNSEEREHYAYKSGTSMAAANVSGVAALLVSANPSCSNTQVYQWITDTARQLTVTNLVGAGIVDAYAALTAQSGLIANVSVKPTLQSEVSEVNTQIQIYGSAGGSGFVQFWLEYGITETPELWFPIDIPQTEPKHNTLLHAWDTSTLDEGIYTLRLSVRDGNDNTIRKKTVVEIRHSPPRISEHEASVWLSQNKHVSNIIWQTDMLTIGSVEIFSSEDNPEQILNTNPLRVTRSDSVNRQHIFYLSDLGLPSGEYLYRMKAQNRAGLTRIDDNDGNLYPIKLQNKQISPLHMQANNSAQLGLHAIVAPTDMNLNGKVELIGVETGTNTAHIFEIDINGDLVMVTTLEKSVSRLWSSGDTDGDGLIELLCNRGNITFLLEQPAAGQFPSDILWEMPDIWGGTIADTDIDGKPEIISRQDSTNSIKVYESDGDNSYREITTLENPTSGKNGLETRFAIGDFDADRKLEILSGDSDGEVFIYENVGDDTYQHTWSETLRDGIPHLFAAGDLDGDGKSEFAIGSKVWTAELDLPRQHWLITIYASTGNNSYRAVWHQRIQELHDGDSGMSIADANSDGKNELCIVTPPNAYLVQYDGFEYRPIWHHTATSTFNPIVTDFDNNGTNEFLFNSENVFSSFISSYSVGTGAGLISPWGVTAKPVNETTVLLNWQAANEAVAYTIYRGESQVSMKPIRNSIKTTHFTDEGLTMGKTYWYAVSLQGSDGETFGRSSPVSVMPTSPPQLLSAVHSPPNQLLVTFDKQMDISVANPARYKLHRQKKDVVASETEGNNTESYVPQSAIFDRSRKRVVLTFSAEVFDFNDQYQIETFQLSDTYGAEILEEGSMIVVSFPSQTNTGMIVYPNPARGEQITFDRLPAGSKITIFDVSGNRITTLVTSEEDAIGDKCHHIWPLNGISSGVYIYVVESTIGRQIGKVSVIR